MLSKGYKYKQEMKLNRYVEVHYMFKCLETFTIEKSFTSKT